MKNGFAIKLLALLLIAAMCVPYLPGCTSSTEYISVSFDKISGKLDNPGMGWSVTEDGTFHGILDNGATGDYPEVDAINYTSTWALMEPQEGVYDFSLLDEAIEKWGNQCGKTLHLRISTDSFMLPSTYTGAPYWLAEKYNVPTQYMDYSSPSPVKQAVAYDVTDENYLRCLDAFLSALAEHLKGVECIGDIDIRGYGLWGEWHTGYVFPTTAQKRNALTALLDKWVNMFAENGNVLVLSASWDPNYIDSYGAAGSDAYTDYYSWAALDYAFMLDNVTFRRDGAGGALLEMDKRLMAEVLHSGKNVYLHGEFNSGAESYTSSSASIDSMTAVNDMLYSLRCNYSTIIGWTATALNDLIEQDKLDWLDRGFEKLGYRLCADYVRYPASVSAGNTFQIFSSWSNTGVGKFTYDYKLAYYFLDDQQNAVASYTVDFPVQNLLLGEVCDLYSQVEVPTDLTAGEYTLAMAIVDECGTPAILLGTAGRIGDSKLYEIGQINVNRSGNDRKDNSYTVTDYEGLQNFEFEANSTYSVTITYTPDMAIEEYALGSTTGYVFRVTNEDGSNASYEKWQDVSGCTRTRTFLFTTGSGIATAEVFSDQFGQIQIGQCVIRKGKTVFAESFSADTNLTDFSASFTTSAGQNSKVLTAQDVDNGTVISGDASIRLFSKTKGFSYGLYQNEDQAKLSPNTCYTLTFKQQYVSGSMGNYSLVAVYHSGEESYDVIGEWSDTYQGVTTCSYTFTTDERGGTLVFGQFNAGEIILDDIVLVENCKGTAVEAAAGRFPRNEIPDFDFGEDVTEDFESGALSATGFQLGTFNIFKMTNDPDLVINGDYSALINVEKANYESLYFELMWTNPDYYTFEPNTTYEITWLGKEIDVPKSAKAYVILRSQEKSYDDRYNIYSYFTGGNAMENHGKITSEDLGEYTKYTWVVDIPDVTDYQFGICFYNYMVMTIDDITISKKAAGEDPITPEDPQGPQIGADETLLGYVDKISVTGNTNTLDMNAKYPINATVNLSFSFVPDSDVTRVLLIAKNYAQGTKLHDQSEGFVWIDIKDGVWSARDDEGMKATVIEEDGVFYVTATYTTPDVAVETMFYQLWSDNGTTVFSDILSTCLTDGATFPEEPEPAEEIVLDYVDRISVTNVDGTVNQDIEYPLNTQMHLSFSFVPEDSVTRVLLIAKTYAEGTNMHDKSKGFVWIDINGDNWSARDDEGMKATVTKENGVYYVTAVYTTPNVEVDTMFYQLWSDNGTTVFSDLKTWYYLADES